MSSILWPIEVAVAWVMVTIHKGLVFLGMNAGAGPAWVLSIVGLTIVVRILIMPLFFKQIRASRGMQLMQPELQALQAKYKGKKDPASQQRMQEEMMALYRKHGTNPFSSCLPILVQMPIFFGLFRVLANLSKIASGEGYNGHLSIGPLTKDLAVDAQASQLFGANLSSSFMNTSDTSVKIVTLVMIVLMSATQFYTMRQLTMKNMPESATNSDNPAMRSQKMMMYIMPLIFAFSGVQFQIGVLIYWLTTNLWTMGQQFWTIHRMPAPGSEAEKKMKARQAARRARKGLPPMDEETSEASSYTGGQRVQPVRKDRQRRSHGALPPTPEETYESGRDEADETPSDQTDPQESSAAGGLSAEEIARRRYEKRARQRRQAAARRKAQQKKKR